MDKLLHSLLVFDNTVLALCVLAFVAGIWLLMRARRMGPWMRWPRQHHRSYWR
jgi:hypothetical protein